MSQQLTSVDSKGIWGQLRILELGYVWFSSSEIQPVIEACRTTLKALRFSHVQLKGNTSWGFLAKNWGGILRLDRVILYGLKSDTMDISLLDDEVIYDWTFRVAVCMMAWVDRRMLELERVVSLDVGVVVRANHKAPPLKQ